MLRVSRSGYLARLIAVDLGNRGREYSVLLTEDSEGTFDWAGRSIAGSHPSVILRGSSWFRNADLCGWSADQIDLLEFGANPCRESWKSIASVLGTYCGAERRSSLTARRSSGGGGYVVLWPRG